MMMTHTRRIQATCIPRKAGYKSAAVMTPVIAAADVALAGLSWPEIGGDAVQFMLVLILFVLAGIGLALVQFHGATSRLRTANEELAALANVGSAEVDGFLDAWHALQRHRASCGPFNCELGFPTRADLLWLRSVTPHMLSEHSAAKLYMKHILAETAARSC